VIWDNRCALHSATGGYPIAEQRIHWRVTIMQDTIMQDTAEQRRVA
jgi:alpha-ketoglutarate-dependent taurine dioxygenase